MWTVMISGICVKEAHMLFRTPASCEEASPVRRTWWTTKVITYYYGPVEERRRVNSQENALLVSSLTENGWHAPTLDFDFPVEARDMGGNVTRLRFPGLSARRRPWQKLLAHLVRIGVATDDLKPHRNDSAYLEEKAPHIDLVVPVRVLPSSSLGHHHVYMDVEMPWAAYLAMCKMLKNAGLLEPGYLRASDARCMTMLLKPGLTKSRLIAEGRMLDPNAKRKPVFDGVQISGTY